MTLESRLKIIPLRAIFGSKTWTDFSCIILFRALLCFKPSIECILVLYISLDKLFSRLPYSLEWAHRPMEISVPFFFV